MKICKRVKKVIKDKFGKKLIPIPQPINTNNILNGKVALITGGNGGIGFAIAKAFIQSGCKVIIAGTNEEKLKDCREQLNNITGNEGFCDYILLNVLNIEAIPEKIELAATKFPEKKIDILVNSAGVNSKLDFFDMTENEYDNIMDVNVKGIYFMSLEISKYMIKNNITGHILNISSSSALRPAHNPYRISKWAVKGITLGLADKLLPYGIVVNAIGPGPVATNMLGKNDGDSIEKPDSPSKRYAVPSEIAALAVFMVSEMGNLIVGDTYYITGGSGLISLHN